MKPKIWQYSAWVKYDGQYDYADRELTEQINSCIRLSEHTILDTTHHNFTPQGFTGVWLLAESHLALHTWPEEGVAYVQLSSCSEPKTDSFIKLFMEMFGDNIQVVENQANDPYKLIP